MPRTLYTIYYGTYFFIAYFFLGASFLSLSDSSAIVFVITPEATVFPPSLKANLNPKYLFRLNFISYAYLVRVPMGKII